MSEAKPFCISKWEVWEAYKRVKANQGAAGVDEQTIADFEKDLKGNLYKIWNRMSSGSYFPPPVRTVKIPKANGGERKLGIPTVSDRIAQMVVKSRLEPAVDPLFHPDSYGYRPRKSALDAVGLELHPEKTKVVYCKDEDRRRTYPNEKFDFLGYTFRPRRSKNRKGKFFINFSPAVSDKAVKAIRAEIRSWDLHLRSDKSIEDLSRMFNPIIRGWLQYYGRFYRSALYPPMRQLDRSLARWADRKYKKLRRHLRRATHWVARISRRDPKLWAHWQMGVRHGSMAGAV